MKYKGFICCEKCGFWHEDRKRWCLPKEFSGITITYPVYWFADKIPYIPISVNNLFQIINELYEYFGWEE